MGKSNFATKKKREKKFSYVKLSHINRKLKVVKYL